MAGVQRPPEPRAPHHHPGRLGGANVKTSFSPDVDEPMLSGTARVHQLASVMGSVTLGERVYVAPFASVRGDEGQNISVATRATSRIP